MEAFICIPMGTGTYYRTRQCRQLKKLNWYVYTWYLDDCPQVFCVYLPAIFSLFTSALRPHITYITLGPVEYPPIKHFTNTPFHHVLRHGFVVYLACTSANKCVSMKCVDQTTLYHVPIMETKRSVTVRSNVDHDSRQSKQSHAAKSSTNKKIFVSKVSSSNANISRERINARTLSPASYTGNQRRLESNEWNASLWQRWFL